MRVYTEPLFVNIFWLVCLCVHRYTLREHIQAGVYVCVCTQNHASHVFRNIERCRLNFKVYSRLLIDKLDTEVFFTGDVSSWRFAVVDFMIQT